MVTPHSNGATPDPGPGPGSGPSPEQAAAARQALIEVHIKEIVDQRVDEVLAARLSALVNQVTAMPTLPAMPTAPAAPTAGGIIATLLANLPVIAESVASTMMAWTQAKVAANPLGHLEVIARTNPRLLALYAPNPLGDQFTNIFATAFAQGMRVAASGRTAATLPLAPATPQTPGSQLTPGSLAPGAPGPLSGPTASPSPAPAGSPVSPLPSGGGSVTMGEDGFTSYSNEQFTALVASVQEEYTRRHAHAV